MSYSYHACKAALFTEEGSAQFISARDKMLALMKPTGAASASLIFTAWEGTADTWTMMAALDRMVELGDVAYLADTQHRAWQDQIVELLKHPR